MLNFPAPEEIAASKMAFADRVIRVKDLQDIDFMKKFGVTQDHILRKIFGIEIETHRRYAIMNWNQLDRLIAEIPQRKDELEKHMSLVDELEPNTTNRNRIGRRGQGTLDLRSVQRIFGETVFCALRPELRAARFLGRHPAPTEAEHQPTGRKFTGPLASRPLSPAILRGTETSQRKLIWIQPYKTAGLDA